MGMDREGLQRYLAEHIPISRALGVSVGEGSPARVRVDAPLEPNLNHRSTAFGGSVGAVAVLAGWGLLRLRVDEVRPVPHLVIQRSSLEYLLPIETDFEACCVAPPQEKWDRFWSAFNKRGRGRIDLAVEVNAGGVLVARFHGTYAALDSARNP
jgi:thioesterase domain-containing protein